MKTDQMITANELIADMRNALGVPEHLTEPQSVQIGYLLSITNAFPERKWLIENLIQQGSVNLWAINNPKVGEVLTFMVGQHVLTGMPFCEQPVQQGAVLTYSGGEFIETQGPVKYDFRGNDLTYLPFQVPLPPDCGLVKNLNQSGVRLNIWRLDQEGRPEEAWVGEAGDLVQKLKYFPDTENAAIICPAPEPGSMDKAIRAILQALTPERMIGGRRLFLTFWPDNSRFGFELWPIEEFGERVQSLVNTPEPARGPAFDPIPVDRIYWLDGGARTCRILCNKNPVEHMEDGDYLFI
ncbi:MAG TPA: hypothetical protein VG096_04260 [Bryobacteraceae bacterium]|nr:hypothetical protein [Bryobacteraceae bacterium]